MRNQLRKRENLSPARRELHLSKLKRRSRSLLRAKKRRLRSQLPL
jgi:hypothetical protein